MREKFSLKIEKLSKIIVFILFAQMFGFSCGRNKFDERLISTQDFKIERPSVQKSGTRFYKEDTFNFNYLIDVPDNFKDSISSGDYHRNIFLILPSRN